MSEKRHYYVVTPLQPLGGRWRSSRRVAFKELSEDLRKHLNDNARDIAYQLAFVDWAEWACKLGAGLTTGAAPDGSHWAVESVVHR